MKTESARAIVCKDDCVLMLYEKENAHEHYVIPGGKREINETLEDAVIREVFEETSVIINSPKHLETIAYVDGDNERVQSIFVCSYVSGEPLLGESPEKKKMRNNPNFIIKPMWVPISKIENIEITPKAVSELFIKKVVLKP